MKASSELPEAERIELCAPVATPRSVLTSRPVLAVAGVLLLGVIAELVPGLAALRVLTPRPAEEQREPPPPAQTALEVGEALLNDDTRSGNELAPQAQAPSRAPFGSAPGEPDASGDTQAKVSIVDPSGAALDRFFIALERTQRKVPGAITRITHFGDSIVVSDYVSGTLRRRFQEQFGDAGHGFTLIANAWPAYVHEGVERYATVGWKVSRVVGPLAADGLYGLGCVSFKADKNVLARFSTVEKGEQGRRVSRFVVLYLEQPSGGSFRVSVDGTPREVVSTDGPVKRSRFHEVRVSDGPHELEVFTQSGVSRLFGVILERDEPGVVLDAIGIQGARIRFLDKQEDAHWAEQLAARSPSLLVYQFGANESADGLLYPMEDYHRTMKEVLAQGQRAVPEASCLVIGAMDRASKRGEELVSVRVIPSIVEKQRLAAAEAGCAFFDTYAAMGGSGSMPRWVRRGLAQADFTHPSSVGADVIATWIYRALMQRYGEFVSRTGDARPNAAPASSSPSRR
ncbi:MAG TPA: hypothetical protein VER33_28265 [Polyangiaceae bacterium]|nr:hypothetical protein [Polyangiaceae bacterium]